jgi:translation elongation factor EF-G
MSIDLLDFFDSQNEVEVTGDSAEKRGGVSARLWQAATSRLGGLVALHLKKAACTALCIGGGGGQECPIAVTQTLIQGFEAASRCGPLAGEPLRGVVWELLEVIGDEAALNTWSATSAMMAACRAAFVNANPRISEPLLMVELLTEGHMAKVQAVLAQRRAEILQSDFIEGNYQEHVIKAEIPAFELFADSAAGFADSLRSAARGKILWTVVFSRWSVISDDPFIEGSVARRILFDLRRRKGLSTGEKIVAVAEKQRTLTRNK